MATTNATTTTISNNNNTYNNSCRKITVTLVSQKHHSQQTKKANDKLKELKNLSARALQQKMFSDKIVCTHPHMDLLLPISAALYIS
jgi:capsid portal protein